jgi:two-component system KDP operon response regulator KdpE
MRHLVDAVVRGVASEPVMRIPDWVKYHFLPSLWDCQHTSSSFTVLVVEPEPHVRRLIDVNLSRQGFQACLADSFQEADILAAERRPDLLILDAGQIDQEGRAAFEHLRTTCLNAPVILITSRQSIVAARLEYALCKMDCCLAKPFNPMELTAFARRIRKALGRLETPGGRLYTQT